jgi:hypothetical protein
MRRSPIGALIAQSVFVVVAAGLDSVLVSDDFVSVAFDSPPVFVGDDPDLA